MARHGRRSLGDTANIPGSKRTLVSPTFSFRFLVRGRLGRSGAPSLDSGGSASYLLRVAFSGAFPRAPFLPALRHPFLSLVFLLPFIFCAVPSVHTRASARARSGYAAERRDGKQGKICQRISRVAGLVDIAQVCGMLRQARPPSSATVSLAGGGVNRAPSFHPLERPPACTYTHAREGT